MSCTFPYGIALGDRGGVTIFPATRIEFVLPGEDSLTFVLLLDSGATISALPRSDAAAFGIDPTAGAPQDLVGVNREPMRGWRHERPVRVGGRELQLPFVFIDADDAPRILGREGVFDRFTIVFEETKRRSALVDSESIPANHIAGAIDELE